MLEKSRKVRKSDGVQEKEGREGNINRIYDK